MPFTSFLMRLLLCVTLTLNGISGASAAVRMAGGHAQHQAATVQAQHPVAMDQAMPPCHGPDAMTSGMHDMSRTATHLIPAEATAAPVDRDPCCLSSACQCACMHLCAATVMASQVTLPASPSTVTTRALSPGHQAPALPHLIRPPIV